MQDQRGKQENGTPKCCRAWEQTRQSGRSWMKVAWVNISWWGNGLQVMRWVWITRRWLQEWQDNIISNLSQTPTPPPIHTHLQTEFSPFYRQRRANNVILKCSPCVAAAAILYSRMTAAHYRMMYIWRDLAVLYTTLTENRRCMPLYGSVYPGHRTAAAVYPAWQRFARF